jgi:antirestriction protein ArdC
MSTATKRRPPLTDKERDQRRAEERAVMKASVEALMTSEGWQRWLKVRRHFSRYSLRNQLLIAQQCPTATYVAGFHRWLALGYCVRKGETSLRIWAPCPPSKKKLDAWRAAGAKKEDTPETYFKLTPVFDRQQVDPLPDFPDGPIALEPPTVPIEGDTLSDLWEPLVAFAASIGSTMTTAAIDGGADGYYTVSTKAIVVRELGPDFSPNRQVAVGLHELAHALVRADRQDSDPELSYADEEIVAETVAYCVCSSVGFDTRGESTPYLASYSQAVGVDALERHAALIDRLARQLEEVAAEVDAG